MMRLLMTAIFALWTSVSSVLWTSLSFAQAPAGAVQYQSLPAGGCANGITWTGVTWQCVIPVAPSALPSASSVLSTDSFVIDRAGVLTNVACSYITGVTCGTGAPSKTITLATPSTQAIPAGSSTLSVSLAATLANYSTAPSLLYSLNGGTYLATSGWTISSSAASGSVASVPGGSISLTIEDAAGAPVSNTVTFNVAASSFVSQPSATGTTGTALTSSGTVTTAGMTTAYAGLVNASTGADGARVSFAGGTGVTLPSLTPAASGTEYVEVFDALTAGNLLAQSSAITVSAGSAKSISLTNPGTLAIPSGATSMTVNVSGALTNYTSAPSSMLASLNGGGYATTGTCATLTISAFTVCPIANVTGGSAVTLAVRDNAALATSNNVTFIVEAASFGTQPSTTGIVGTALASTGTVTTAGLTTAYAGLVNASTGADGARVSFTGGAGVTPPSLTPAATGTEYVEVFDASSGGNLLAQSGAITISGGTKSIALTNPGTLAIPSGSTSMTVSLSGTLTNYTSAPSSMLASLNAGAYAATGTCATLTSGAFTTCPVASVAGGTGVTFSVRDSATLATSNTVTFNVEHAAFTTQPSTTGTVGTALASTGAASCQGLTTAYAGLDNAGTADGARVSFTCGTASALPALTPGVSGTETIKIFDAASSGNLLAQSNAITVSPSGPNFTVSAVAPTAIGTVGANVPFTVTITAGGTCGLPSSVTVDGSAVTASNAATVDSTHCSFTIVGPAVSSTNYAIHTIVANGAGSGSSSNATSLFIARTTVAYNFYDTQTQPTAIVQGSGGLTVGYIYFGIKSGDTGNGALFFGAPNSAQPSQPSYVGSGGHLYAGVTTSQFVPPGPVPASAPTAGKYLVDLQGANGTYFDYNNTVYSWAAGTYYLMFFTPDGGVFVSSASLSGT